MFGCEPPAKFVHDITVELSTTQSKQEIQSIRLVWMVAGERLKHWTIIYIWNYVTKTTHTPWSCHLPLVSAVLFVSLEISSLRDRRTLDQSYASSSQIYETKLAMASVSSCFTVSALPPLRCLAVMMLSLKQELPGRKKSRSQSFLFRSCVCYEAYPISTAHFEHTIKHIGGSMLLLFCELGQSNRLFCNWWWHHYSPHLKRFLKQMSLIFF